MQTSEKKILEKEREGALHQVEDMMETPMNVLAGIWLLITVFDLTRGINDFFINVMNLIWIIFWIDYILKFSLAARKKEFITRNWLTLISLLVPALRLFRALRALRAFRAARALRGSHLVRILGSFNRGMRALSATLGRRGFRFVLALTLIVILLGGAGIFTFEDRTGYITDMGTAIWWSAMMITTMGTDYYPKTPEGRLLGLLLAIYGFTVFGYVTATIATFFIDREAAHQESEVAGASEITKLQEEVATMSAMLRELRNELGEKKGPRKRGPER